MRLISRKSTPTRVRKHRAGLQMELLECRLAPALITVNATANVHPIDPNIYGTAYATTAQLNDLNIPLNRSGGNSSDTYSYQQDSTNHGSDWFFESIKSGNGNGQGMDSWINETRAGGAQPSITLNLFDWAAKNAVSSTLGSFPVSQYGAQQSVDPWNTNLGNGVRTNGTNITGNDPNIAYVPNSPAFEQVWIQHLIDTFGNSQNGGVQYYTLGNEPGLWNSTHRDIHPNGVTNAELLNRVIAYASMVKSLDPNAKILGFEEWGWTNYFINGADSAAQNWGATYNGLNFQTWMLDQMRQHDTATGQRLLDYFTLHFYPQAGQFSDDVSNNMQLLRNRSTRSLWDPNHVDESWINTTGINGGKVNLINMMKNWVNTYYPGTKLGITEYNWGAEGNMNGATTQADIWGIFGREGLDLANRWTTPATNSPTYLAMKMYRNYDGSDSTFGESSVSASVANPDQVSAFASVRADGALTIMVVNKNLYSSGNPSATTPITIDLSNFTHGGISQAWQLAATNPSNQNNAAISHLSNISISGNSFTINVPQESVTLFVIPAASGTAPAAPTGLSATPGSGQVTLSWNAVSGATSYKIYRSTASGAETLFQSGVATTSFLNTGLTNGTTYFYKVSAVNANGESPLSAEASATPQVAAPAAPTGLAATPGNGQVSLAWNAVSGATSYKIYRGTASGAETLFQSGITATNFLNTGLTNGTTYFYKVTAVNAGGESPQSSEASATPQVAAPAAPTGLAAVAGDGQVSLSWNAVSGATSYKVYRGTASGAETLLQSGLATTSFLNTGLTNGTTYFYKVTAVNAGGESPLSAEVSATPQVPSPAPPTSLSAIAVSISQIDLTWTDNSTNETGFVVERATDSNFTAGLTTVALGANATSYSASGLTATTTYWFRVRATNAGGASTNSNVASATTQTPPPTGVGLAATYFNNSNFTGTSVSRTDATIDFDWGTGSPASGIAPNSFSVRWRGQVQTIESGNYRFRTLSDQGVRVWLNGRLIIDNWTAHTVTTNTSAVVALIAGKKYDIRVQYYDNTGAAVAKLLWLRPDQTAYEAIPQSQLYLPGDGLQASYFDNSDFTGTMVSRIDPTVAFNWGTAAPANGIGPDSFSARWTGQLLPVESGTYTFRTNSNDGVRLWVNGQLIIDNWTAHTATFNTAKIALQAGQKYDIRLEYYDNSGGSIMKLQWKRPGQTAFVAIPHWNLFSTEI